MNNLFLRAKIFLDKKELLNSLSIKELKGRYANTILGFLWAVITPLLLSLIVAFVFSYITQSKEEKFIAYVISGLLPWICFSTSLQDSSNSLIHNASLWKQFGVPLEFIPASRVIVNFINLFIGLCVATPFLITSSPGAVKWFLLLPVVLVLHFFFTLGFSFVVAALYTRFRDTAYVLNLLLLFWLWSSPVFYLLDRFPPVLRSLLKFNIIVPYLNLYRVIFYNQAAFSMQDLFSATALSAISFLLGYAVFIKQEQFLRKAL